MNLSKSLDSSYVCVSNVHMTIEAFKDDEYLKVVNGANIVTPDGMPLAKAMKFLYGTNQERVAGMDIMPSLMDECTKNNQSILLYGSTVEVLDKIIEKKNIDFPNLRLETYSPPFRDLTPEEDEKIIAQINQKRYDYIFVALGCPKQEKWMYNHKDKIKSCMIGLGGALEVYAGIKKRAPEWMQKYSLEWLYRLVQDPQRLWKRYVYTNSLFVILFIQQYVNLKLFGKSK